MWAVMCVCRHVCHTQAQSCLSTGWAFNRCFAWGFGTAAVLAQGGGRGTVENARGNLEGDAHRRCMANVRCCPSDPPSPVRKRGLV